MSIKLSDTIEMEIHALVTWVPEDEQDVCWRSVWRGIELLRECEDEDYTMKIDYKELKCRPAPEGRSYGWYVNEEGEVWVNLVPDEYGPFASVREAEEFMRWDQS